MQKWVALLRGVNVGGGNKVPMKELRGLCEAMGWCEVQSYIASGNLVFVALGSPEALAAKLRDCMRDNLDVDVPVMVLPAGAVAKALSDLPYEVEKGNQAHAFFLFGPPALDEALRDRLIAPSEHLEIIGDIAWLHAPEGIGRSKLMEKIGKVLGVEFTARNLNTVRKLVDMSA